MDRYIGLDTHGSSCTLAVRMPHWLRRTVDMDYLLWPALAEDAIFLEGLRGTRELQRLLHEVKPRWEVLVEWERTLGRP